MSDDTSGLEVPAPWIDGSDRDWAFLVRMILDEVARQLDEAALVLALYEAAAAEDAPPVQGEYHAGPPSSARRLRFLYAKSFVYSLDVAGQLVRILAGLTPLPEEALSCCAKFQANFGALRDLRNTLQHVEDRLRGLGPHGKPVPSPLIVLGGFRNGVFGATTAEGPVVEIEVSRATLKAACTIVEDLMWSFDWIGPGNLPVTRKGGKGA
jgi:hypothetical protein